ncbi:probable LRR receptor-like serine/threonine-protein kinase At3g47570 [Actinidia eriantha]|uniref:probable LRR receptor-like serine/threonine-protein kinase At3g47570 n=1 Tax=Actinidia eriantha TaxID=165200 RepID=UPI00258ED2D0|nr:probable LRR receptor-like serine/threonine-protein kinase At3g47570 [Actinidia eriantha]XP_057461292.1 probable LRR receptor-like serine/threonine-protein kinase At3g47570 [Actinidia eriantha]
MGFLQSCPLFLFTSIVLAVLSQLGSSIPHVAGSEHGRNETDRLALLAFKAEITSDPFGSLNSWNQSFHFCQWTGVTCGRRHQRVTVLNLDDRKLAGPISPHVGNLSFLRKLQLGNNSLSHEIPQEIGRLKRLQILLLDQNSFTGEIPANISGCLDLTVLNFSRNSLGGKIPVELGSLSKLKYLFIDRNNLTGSVPPTLGNLSSLIVFVAESNNISGSIPDVLGGLTNLDIFGLGGNMLVGTIPLSIFNMSSLRNFNMVWNQLQGSLPSSFGNTLPNLGEFSIGTNLFTGYIPDSLSNASKLVRLEMGSNKFIGKIPSLEKLYDLSQLSLPNNYLGVGEAGDLDFLSSLTNATYLSYMDVRTNNLGGMLSESIGNLSSYLSALLLADNKISGIIPSSMRKLVNLQSILLFSNQFTGNIPIDLWNLQKLNIVSIRDNRLSGNIPSSLENLTLLYALHLDENNFHGSIPPSLGKCHSLEDLSFGSNNLSGTIPQELATISSLLFMNLSQNQLSGSVPLEVGNLKNLEALDLSENMLSGQIPSTLGSCVKLTFLDMEGNIFSGSLPSSLRDLRGFEVIDLSHNRFSGKIPDYFEGFVFLRILNLSFNDFEGAVPERGIFKIASVVSLEGNDKLCGGIPELQLHSCNSKGLRRNRFTFPLKVTVATIVGLFGLILVLLFLYLCWFKKTKKASSFRVFGNSFMPLSYQNLLKATDGFSQDNLLGIGGFGSVYKGILDQGDRVVAVKVLNLQFRGASKSFIAECKALKSIRHRNLVKVLTACSSVDYNGNDFKALVYEFMVNGSLEKWLHPNENENEVSDDSRSLSLQERLNIAIDVACALDYLHHYGPEPIVHCDLKPGNILLDGELTGHVGDFGIARFLPNVTYESGNQSSSIGVKGSIGYAAPEYGMGSKVSTSGDVYSYGILLLEMFTGKRPTDHMFSDSLSLHNFAKMAFPEQVASIADSTLFQQKDNDLKQCSTSGQEIEECLISIFKAGIACSEELPRNRLAINEVLTQLHAIKNTLLGSARKAV